MPLWGGFVAVLDIKIFFKTILIVLRKSDIYNKSYGLEEELLDLRLNYDNKVKDKVKEYAKYLGANAIHPHYAVALQAPGLIEGCKASGVAIHPWTVDSIDTMRKLMSMGVDAIITDKPDEAVKIRRNLWCAVASYLVINVTAG